MAIGQADHSGEQPDSDRRLAAVGWAISGSPVAYDNAVSFMETRVAAIAAGTAPELVWLLEHPPLYTAGTSAKPEDLLQPDRFPVHRTGRGGQYTYHGPGQRVIYVMLDARRRSGDVKAFVHGLEAWAIEALAAFGITGETRCDRVGVWVRRPERGARAEDKIAAIGIRLRRWISFHGMAINVTPDLAHFSGIVPCGIEGYGVTSIADLSGTGGRTKEAVDSLAGEAMMDGLDRVLRQTFEARFGSTQDEQAPEFG